MSKEEILSAIDKLQRRWQFHKIEHSEKRNNHNPSYDAYAHGVATGYLKALNTFSDWIRRLDTEKDLALTWQDVAKIITIYEAGIDNGDYRRYNEPEWMKEYSQDILRKFNEQRNMI